MAIISVTTTADSGTGSLRAAIASAGIGDTIKFASSLANQTIKLTSGQLQINNDITIDGAGAANLKISGNNATRVFLLERQLNVTFKNLTIIDGQTGDKGGAIRALDYGNITIDNCEFNSNSGGVGGAIHLGYGGRLTVLNSSFDGNDGTLPNINSGHSSGAIATAGTGNLIVKNSQFTNNKGVNGGAIYSLLGQVLVENSDFFNNSSEGDMGGGAIFTDGANPIGPGSPIGGKVIIRDSWFEGNQTKGEGGALFLYGYVGDTTIIENSTIVGNKTSYNAQGFSRGGGLRVRGKLIMNGVTVANNTTDKQGGGLWLDTNALDGNSPVNIINSTFSGNQVNNDAGGAMFLNTGSSTPVNIVNSTIVDNSAGRAAGAIWVPTATHPVTLTNSIIANNTANTTKIQNQVDFTLRDGGGNIEFPSPVWRGNRVVLGSQIVDPLLGSLQEINGVLVHPLKSGSPAINAGIKNSYVPLVDQGWVVRDALPDIGAFEVTTSRSTTLAKSTSQLSSNYVHGTKGNDTLTGDRADNIVLGGYGNDVLIGGYGKDMLIGGGGNDKYVYRSWSENGDTIIGFDPKQELIDISQVIDKATFISSDPFNDYVKLGQSGRDTIVNLDLNGDKLFHQLLTLRNVTATSLTANNFVL